MLPIDEHFRRSLGANYQSLFKKDKSPQPMDTDSPPQQQPQQQQQQPSPKEDSPNSNSSAAGKVEEKQEEQKKKDPVKAFQEDMDMEGYTGGEKILFSLQRQLH